MKIAVLGGGGLRVPLLARSLAAGGFGVEELALFDPDRTRLAALARVARVSAPRLRIRETTVAAEAIRGSRFVIAGIRVGGQQARAHDERVCLDAGVLGQETVGAAGAALALRNVPAMLDLARIVEREAPDAVLVNYTNPAGMVTEALLRQTPLEVIGICDTPAGLVERVAGLLYLDPAACSVGWSGINHLGWLTALYANDPGTDPGLPPENRLGDLFRDPDRLLRVHRGALFDESEMAGAVPSEYVSLHLHPGRARERLAAAGATRGGAILELEAGLFAALAAAAEDPRETLAAYRNAMEAREASYFEIEAGGGGGAAPTKPAGDACSGEEASGYDRIGLAVIRACLDSEGAEIVVNTRNRTPAGAPAIPELPTGDVVEVPARVGAEGVAPIPQPPLPVAAGSLLRRARDAEREIVRAALAGDPGIAAEALRHHPAGGPDAAAVLPRLRLPRAPGA